MTRSHILVCLDFSKKFKTFKVRAFSIQFKLSAVKYVNATGVETGEAAGGWEEAELIEVSPTIDQYHYLNFYVVQSIAGGDIYGSSSFPEPPITLDDCKAVYGWYTDGNECLQQSFFARMKLIGDDENQCNEILLSTILLCVSFWGVFE